MRLLPIAILAAAVTAAPASTQVFVVDEQGGPGSQFTDLPAAIAAVPSGATLRVRSGNYTGPTVVGKALNIVGENAALVRISRQSLQPEGVFQTAPGQVVLWKDLTLEIAEVQISATQGPVVMDNVHSTVAWFHLMNASNVQLHRMHLPASGAVPGTARVMAVDSVVQISRSSIAGYDSFFSNGQPAVELVRSRGVSHATTLIGGAGQHWCGIYSCNAGAGGPAVRATGTSSFLALDTEVLGGPGFNEWASARVCATGGGHGIELSGASTARFEGRLPAGGRRGEPGSLLCFPTVSGSPILNNSSGSVAVDPNSSPPSASLMGTAAIGQTAIFTVNAIPSSTALLLLSTDGTLIPLEPTLPGSLLAGSIVVAAASVPASGTHELGFAIPGSVPLGWTLFGQFITVEPGGRAWVTNSFPWHVSS